MKLKSTIWWTNPEDGEEYNRNFYIDSMEMSGSGWVRIKDIEVEFEVPSQEVLVPQAVASLTEQKNKVLARAEMEARTIEERIQKLLAISWEETR